MHRISIGGQKPSLRSSQRSGESPVESGVRCARALTWTLLWAIAPGCSPAGPARGEDPRPQAHAGAVPDGVAAMQDPTTPPKDTSEQDGYVGVIAASERADVGPAVAGEVVQVHVRLGDHVEAGDPLATLDARRAREDLWITEATLRSEKAALNQAGVDREAAMRRLAEAQHLADAGVGSPAAVEDVRFEYRRAEAAEARVAAVVAQWRTKRAQLVRQLADTKLRAPFSGTVAERYLDPGGMAGPGAPVVRLISSNALRVRFAVPPHDLSALSVGTIVATRIEDPVVTADAIVRQIAPETDPTSRLVFVEAQLDLDESLQSSIQAGAAAWVRPVPPVPARSNIQRLPGDPP